MSTDPVISDEVVESAWEEFNASIKGQAPCQRPREFYALSRAITAAIIADRASDARVREEREGAGALAVDNKLLLAALAGIGKQKLSDELDEEAYACADWEYGYDEIIKIARAALNPEQGK